MPQLFQDFQHENLHIEPLLGTQEKLRGFLKELHKGVVFNSSVYARYLYSIGTPKNPNRLLFPLRMIFFAPLRYIPGSKHFIRWLHSVINPLKAHDYLFEKYKPDLVFNTCAAGDCGVLKSAKRFEVTTVDMPKSWDNVSQALFPTKADFLVVWNDFMREKAAQLQGYSDDEIFVTGIPQFDFYARKNGLLSREEFCKKHDFDPAKKIILYGSSGARLFDESKYVRLIKKFIKKGEISDTNILIRPHLSYRGDIDQFSGFKEDKGVSVDTSDRQNHVLRDHFDTSIDHVHNLFNSLYHADVCVNAASTLSLDAVACGTEVVNFNFDAELSLDKKGSIRRLFVSDYVKELMMVEGTHLAKSKDEFLRVLKNILEEGACKNKQKIVNRFMYKLDGRSAERISDVLIGIIEDKTINRNINNE